MTDPIAFRPTEKTDKILKDYIERKGIKKSDAINELIEGCFSFSLSPKQTPTDPTTTSTPLIPPTILSANKPRDCSECRERCNMDYYHCKNGLNDRPAPH